MPSILSRYFTCKGYFRIIQHEGVVMFRYVNLCRKIKKMMRDLILLYEAFDDEQKALIVERDEFIYGNTNTFKEVFNLSNVVHLCGTVCTVLLKRCLPSIEDVKGLINLLSQMFRVLDEYLITNRQNQFFMKFFLTYIHFERKIRELLAIARKEINLQQKNREEPRYRFIKTELVECFLWNEID